MNNNSALKFPNYQIIECIHQGSKSIVYRARRISDNQLVILKFLRSEYPTFNELVQFRNQYTIIQNLNLPGVTPPLSLENYRNSLVLVMLDEGYVSLAEYIQDYPLGLSQCLIIGIKLAQILEGLYQHKIIHKDIKPANIIIHPQSLEIQLIDFSIASLLPQETQILKNPNILEGTLAYISPEQTGRMNRGIDYRTDFYSLGVTLYEFITGKLPFETTDVMELVHCHIAKSVPDLQAVTHQEIPEMISKIVMKLMAKNAEDRYQTAFGLKHDLEKCFYQLKENGKIEKFEIGNRDISERFIIPEKLYGRQQQIQQLLDAFVRVASPQEKGVASNPDQNRSEMILVAGYSGVGKTAVVNEVHKPIVRQRGYFIKGKYDQFQRNIPFSAFMQALRDLMGQLLSENDTKLQQWKDKILKAVGENGQVIIEVIPELEKIIGEQAPITELSGTAAQNRFNLLFQKFIQVFTTKEHPLVIFLDDLQWADSASLNLIKLLMSEAGQYLLLIGSYRDNEVNPAHPLILILDEIQKNQAIVNTITLAPLRQYDLNQLVADTLHCSLQKALPLTQAVYQKTQGNPFFATQFLKALYEDKIISFNPEEGLWQCDLAQVKLAAVSEDVVEFVSKRLQKLNPLTQNALKLAACIGNQFDLETLAIVRQTSEVEIATDLWVALQEGLILPTTEVYKFYTAETTEIQSTQGGHLSASYKFLHDRIQQASYALIPEDKKKETHFKIGQLLLNNTPKAEQDEKIFEIVNQLNYGRNLITNQTERNELAQLNLRAGQKAKASTAYQAAVKYLSTGMEMLAAESWRSQYDLTLTVYVATSEAAYLSGDFDQMEQLFEIILKKSRTLLDLVAVYHVKIQAHAAQNQQLKAIETALPVLELLGVSIPQKPSPIDIQRGLEETHSIWSGKRIEDLSQLPVMSDPQKLAAMKILGNLIFCAYQAAPDLLPLIVSQQVNLSVKHGNTAGSAFAYSCYGLILCGVVGDIEIGYKFGKLALQILSQFQAKEIRAKTLLIIYGDVIHWRDHARETLQPLLNAYADGLETGDLIYAALSALMYTYHCYVVGEELGELEHKIAKYCEAISNLKQDTTLNHLKIFGQACLNLRGKNEHDHEFKGEIYDENILLPLHQQANDVTALYYLYFNKLILSYLLGDYLSAQENAVKAMQYLEGATGLILVPIFYFYDSLIRIALFEENKILDQVIANQEKLKKWAEYSPKNNFHKFNLVEAEKHRVLGQKLEAMELYDKAIAGAKENEYIQEEALANELAAKFYLEFGRKKVAQTYMIEAYYCYSHWGAKAKIQDLEQRYPQLLAPILEQQKISLNPFKTIASLGQTSSQTQATISSNTTGISDALDFTSIIKASQALSSEIELNQLISQLMQVMMENAGATKGVLILSQASQLTVQAIYTHNSNDNEGIYCTQQLIPVEESLAVPLSVINLVKRRLEPLNLHEISSQTQLASDDYFIQQQPQSLLCLPLCSRGVLLGILYLENNLATGAFTEERVEVLKLLCSQAVISLENARLYQQSQDYAQQLEQSLKELQEAQVQLVQSEKMSALGQMMSGIAHEINNPVGFIGGNLSPAEDYVQDLIEHLNLYQEKFPEPGEEIEENAEEIDLDYVLKDLPQLISSMKTGVDRITEISTSMRIFARSDQDKKVAFDVHEGIDSTLLILKHRLKANEKRPDIQIIKDYENSSKIMGFPGQLNQVFMNIIANAVDVFDEISQSRENITANPPKISIKTEIISSRQVVVIRIKDNGCGMSEDVKNKIFDHLFTTKAVGKGTGLGLAISRQIVEEKHRGQLICHSEIGEGTEFVIEIPNLTL